MSEVSRILIAIASGDRQAAAELMPLVYAELRQMAAAQMLQERPCQTLQATALVHEAYLRLLGHDQVVIFENRRHFFGAAAEAMRRILVDQARQRVRLKRGGDRQRVPLDDQAASTSDEEVLGLHEALPKLAAEDPLAAEVISLKYFAGLGREAIAETLGLSIHECRQKLTYALAWLRVALEE